jgi:rod shape-determining protein MreD
MDYSSERILATQRETRIAHYRAFVLVLVPFLTLLYQTYVPLFFEPLAYLESTLLVTIYFAMMRHSQVNGIIVGALMGLAKDALVHVPLGIFGISFTLIGFFAASIGIRIDVSSPFVRLLACFAFYWFHQFLYWLMSHALLARQVPFDWHQTLVLAGLNAVVGLALFHFLDKLKEQD